MTESGSNENAWYLGSSVFLFGLSVLSWWLLQGIRCIGRIEVTRLDCRLRAILIRTLYLHTFRSKPSPYRTSRCPEILHSCDQQSPISAPVHLSASDPIKSFPRRTPPSRFRRQHWYRYHVVHLSRHERLETLRQSASPGPSSPLPSSWMKVPTILVR